MSDVYRDQDSFIGYYHVTNDKKDDYFVYADVYRVTFEEVLNSFLRKRALLRGHDYGTLPMIFLLRHYIEIQLKALILGHGGSFGRTHDIEELMDLLSPIMRGRPISKTAKAYMLAIGKLDKRSDGFRYPYQRDGQKFFQNLSKSEKETLRKINRLKDLKRISKLIIGELETSEGYFDPEVQAAMYEGL